MTLRLSVTLIAVFVGSAACQEAPDCAIAASPAQFVLLSTGTSDHATDARFRAAVGRGCGQILPPLKPAQTATAPVSVASLAVPKRARKRFDAAKRALGRRPPDFSTAESQVEQALKCHGAFSEAWDLLGRLLMRRGDERGAEDAFEKAIAADPTFVAPHLELGLIALVHGRPADALRLSERALRLSATLAEAQYYRAAACHALDKTECAFESARAVVSAGKDRTYPRVHLILGDLMASHGDFRSAADEYGRLIELDPESRAAVAAAQTLASWKAQRVY